MLKSVRFTAPLYRVCKSSHTTMHERNHVARSTPGYTIQLQGRRVPRRTTTYNCWLTFFLDLSNASCALFLARGCGGVARACPVSVRLSRARLAFHAKALISAGKKRRYSRGLHRSTSCPLQTRDAGRLPQPRPECRRAPRAIDFVCHRHDQMPAQQRPSRSQ